MPKQRSSANEKPRQLTMRLFDPGMSIIHRAGLGGLACTLKTLERAYEDCTIDDEYLPGGPWENGTPPWTVESLQVTLNLGEPENAREYLKRLFLFAFDLQDGWIYLPGQYGTGLDPPAAVRAQLQAGLTLTFLQHGKTRKLGTESAFTTEVDGKQLTYPAKNCAWYKHQDGWKELCDKNGVLKAKPVDVIGPLNPGAVVRHVAFSSKTKIAESVSHVLPLHFALVGCLALPVNRGCGVLVIPEVTDLNDFTRLRPFMTPSTLKDCSIRSAGDAALQAQIRIRAKAEAEHLNAPECQAAMFQPTQWSTQQKSRVRTMDIPVREEERLREFEMALQRMPPRVAVRKVKETVGRGKNKQETEREECFLADSIIRPLIADNIALGRRWYQDFTDLMVKIDPVSKRPFRDRVLFEKKGLTAMVEEALQKESGEYALVRAVHEAMRRRYGVIADENEGKPVAMKKRWGGEYDRWRLAFAGAKTADQFRHALCDLLSRAGINPVLKERWEQVLPMLGDRCWQLTRDLALLALASYAGTGSKEIIDAVKSGDESENAA